MPKLTFLVSITATGLFLLTGHMATAAQSSSLENSTASPQGAPVNAKYDRNWLSDTAVPAAPVDDVRLYGSIAGRVFNDLGPIDARSNDLRHGVSGVKVILKSSAPGFAGFIGDQLTDENGNYNFSNLAPGKYSVEIDPISVPAKYRMPDTRPWTIDVESSRRAFVELPVAARRIINGIVFIDKDGDGVYKAGKDEPVRGAVITVGDNMAVTNDKGWYTLRDLPEGRIGILVQSPLRNQNTHIVLDLGNGAVTGRIVNVPMFR